MPRPDPRGWSTSTAERVVTPHPAFDAILRETIAEVRAAEAIDEADAREARDGIEQLRLRAAHLITREEGGPWVTGARVQFAPEGLAGAGTPSLDIHFPPRPPAVSPEGPAAVTAGPAGAPARAGRRFSPRGKPPG